MIRSAAITGIPGSGKTTLAQKLAASGDWSYISTGDIARRIDPSSLSAGRMADERAFRVAYLETMAGLGHPDGVGVVLDGIPRSREQVEMLLPGMAVVFLTCRPDIARDRLSRRQRDDDTPDLIERRITEQSALLEADTKAGWAFTLAGWAATVNTSRKTADEVYGPVHDYLRGLRKEAF